MPLRYLILSTFEGGYQPITALAAAAALRCAGHDASFHDIYVDGLDDSIFDEYDVFVISVPLFDSLSAGVQLAERIQHHDTDKIRVFFGQYATINAARLVPRHGEFAIAGEWEKPLVALARRLEGKDAVLDGIVDADRVRSGEAVRPYISRDHLRVLDRSLAPPITKYPQPQATRLLGREERIGGLESTRGCRHKCTYCSVFAAYGGKVIVGGQDIVEADVGQLIDQGMTHLTFMDAEFFNAKRKSVALLARLHSQFPNLTYDFTTRVDHLCDSRDLLPHFAELGVRFITSALEFPKQEVLDAVAKETTVQDTKAAIAYVRSAGIEINPTFIMYNPWIDYDDIERFFEFITEQELEGVVDPVQYETRLHLYKGSPLLALPSIRGLTLEEHEFHYHWSHHDTRVDDSFYQNVTPAEEGVFKRCCLKC